MHVVCSIYVTFMKQQDYGPCVVPSLPVTKTNIEPRMWQYYLGEPSSHLVVVQVHWIISVLSGTMIFFSLDMGFAFTAHNASAVMIILGLIECVIYDHGTLLSIVSDKELI